MTYIIILSMQSCQISTKKHNTVTLLGLRYVPPMPTLKGILNILLIHMRPGSGLPVCGLGLCLLLQDCTKRGRVNQKGQSTHGPNKDTALFCAHKLSFWTSRQSHVNKQRHWLLPTYGSRLLPLPSPSSHCFPTCLPDCCTILTYCIGLVPPDIKAAQAAPSLPHSALP